MDCCLGFTKAKAVIEGICIKYYPSDYKIFVASRQARQGIGYSVRLGVVVKPDVMKNTEMFEDFTKLHARSDVCIKVLSSDINFGEQNLVDIFVLEIESEVI